MRGYCKFGSSCKYKHVKFGKKDETIDISEQLKVKNNDNYQLHKDITNLRNDLQNY